MKSILIIGCGLLGSSLLRRIHKKKLAKKIFIYEKSKSNISKIIKLKLPGTVVKTLKEGATNSDLIILCTPMSEYKKIIIKLNNFNLPKKLITDIGSSKIESSKIIKKFLRKNLSWIQSHPIAGSEVSGPEHGKEDMFVNRWCILIKDKNTKKNELNILNRFWKKIGSKVVFMESEKHDKIFSITSHLPHLIAYNLVKSAQDFEKKQNYDLIKFSAGGLRDFSRIAASNEIMWRDIFFNNKNNISKAIDLFVKNLNSFKKDINSKNNKSILRKLVQTKKVRSKIIKLKQDIDKPDFGRN
ncbi:prephenate dehydrogenase/arogenate dehydrogenase family protein [Pelagibacterales bacterium SAG-MED09]|nr:prephenate dehydrogenase/arogenate dehydrogenase family protein [Pelagibacterales bacterium SAG-MED09]